MPDSLSSTIKEANSVLYGDAEPTAVAAYFTDDYVAHVTSGDLVLGHDGVQSVLNLYRRAFPDAQVDVEILVQHGDRVGWQRTFRATHLGAFRGFPPTRRPIVWREMVTSRFRDGRIAEEWLVSDLAEHLLAARKG